ncbi:MAG: DM13 domain-containing protein, partial [Armatimonadetes bacterium]|nr:DM13 domain-containing protein [Armatimonadota bacterium]
AAPEVKDSAAVKQAGFVDLGSIKGNQGDQNYSVPTDLDLGKYRTVTIWCKRFGVNFGSASLAGEGARMAATR